MQTGLKFSGYPTPADSHFLGGSSISARKKEQDKQDRLCRQDEQDENKI